MAALKQRHNRWEAKVRIPKELRPEHQGREFLYRTIPTFNIRTAKAEADSWEAALRAEWAEKLGHDSAGLQVFRDVYGRVRKEAEGSLEDCAGDPACAEAGIDQQIDRMAAEIGEAALSEPEAARLAALQDAKQALAGQPIAPRPELELPWKELTAAYLASWKAQGGLKPTNTEQQKRATFALFGGYWRDRPIRGVKRVDVVRFMDDLRKLAPEWGRPPRARTMTWQELQLKFGGGPGPSDATMNRHAATLKALWEWAADRDHCEGRNPFSGLHKKLRVGVNVAGYIAWEPDDLRTLFDPPPKREDLNEIMLVALYTGMRLDEIASLRREQIREQDGIHFVQVEDAKTPAGNRQVPIHPAIGWLIERAKRAPAGGRLWPLFNPEGPGKKPGADAGREFSRFKAAKGFTDRRKVFHSFRKNVTRQMERGGVPENEWAQVFGHEKGFTYGRYNPDGIALERKAEIIGIIEYPGIRLPHPAPPSGS